MRRGQLSVFIIIGLILLVIVGFFFLMFSDSVEIPQDSSTSGVHAYVEKCLSDVGLAGIGFVAQQGGYYNPPETAYPLSYFSVPYYYGIDPTVPSPSEVEEEIALYVQDRLGYCLADFAPFVAQGYSIDEGNVAVRVVVGSESVSFALDYPLTITKQNTIETLTNYEATVPSALSLLYDTSQQIVLEHEDNSKMPLSALTELANENEVDMNLAHFNSTVVYYLTSEEEVFQFAIFYKWGDPLA